MVVVDEDNWVTLWDYDKSSFSGHGWFRPKKKVQLDFVVDGDLPTVLEVKLSSTGSEIFFLTSYPDSLKVFLLELNTLQFLPTIIDHPIERNRGINVPPTINISSIVQDTFSDYVVLVCQKEIFFYSVATGKKIDFGGREKIHPNSHKINGPVLEVREEIMEHVTVTSLLTQSTFRVATYR